MKKNFTHATILMLVCLALNVNSIRVCFIKGWYLLSVAPIILAIACAVIAAVDAFHTDHKWVHKIFCFFRLHKADSDEPRPLTRDGLAHPCWVCKYCGREFDKFGDVTFVGPR